MEKSTIETISAAYTMYTLLNPADRVVVSIDSFAAAYNANLSALENAQNVKSDAAPQRNNEQQFSETKAEETLKRGFHEAESTLDDKEKLSSLLVKLKQKMKSLPMVGSVLANVPTMFKLMNSFLKNEYTEVPRKELVIIVSALSYLVSPIDLIPDFIPVVGLVDDMAVVSLCIKATQSELEKYLAWRESKGLSNSFVKDEE